MAIAITTHTTKPRSSSFFADLSHSLWTWRQRRIAAAELRSLDDRMLADLGVTRSEIDRVVRDGVRR